MPHLLSSDAESVVLRLRDGAVSVLLALVFNLFCGRCYVALVECPVPLEGVGCPVVRPLEHLEAP